MCWKDFEKYANVAGLVSLLSVESYAEWYSGKAHVLYSEDPGFESYGYETES
jgi:hypothetical protein